MNLFFDGKIRLHCGDCVEILPTLVENSIDSCVCDPPYGLQFMGREWDKLWRNGTEADKAYVDRTGGELTSRARKLPDYKASNPRQMQIWHELWTREVYRVLKPGAHLIAFGGTRTYHRMACAIEDAGFEIRDQIGWCYGSGFPKSHNIGNGLGTALKPAWEPIVLARKPLSESTVAANVLKWGTGALNIDGCRVDGEPWKAHTAIGLGSVKFFTEGDTPVIEKSPHQLGRWPANIIHDGSEEVVAGFPQSDGQNGVVDGQTSERNIYNNGVGPRPRFEPRGDSGSVARFFYTAKADSDDRLGSKHPTVKPLDLMQYLVRLVTPPKGTVLDCFAGTGTTGEAAFREGFSGVLIEREAEYQSDIRRRMGLVLGGPEERARESIKERMKDKPRDEGPLFSQTGR